MILANHTSFLDTLMFAVSVPPTQLTHFATLVSPALFKIPMLGTIMKSVGHISVPYRDTNATGNFSLDASQRGTMVERVESHLANGGWICMYPEGQIHRGSADGDGSLQTGTLQTFRAGGMAFLLEHDMEVWGWVTRGNNDCWPRTGQGGQPASISVKVFPIARDGARALMKVLPPDEGTDNSEDARTAQLLFATHAQALMQEELNALYRER
eukprot:CAMPEP_0174739318 /NCGR_PEP_ID=MMETSP1094-20130205/71371_1 /TAXON_ID=156173 /ORGANISM="Chrysochromulina brevifilum, Strain UTEX LB 985" /LENGTH=211 /DNA_ID=CAMNT_0015942861 /DNA_START=206 /DNA_END=841 /DNA_ORIENTATION=-